MDDCYIQSGVFDGMLLNMGDVPSSYPTPSSVRSALISACFIYYIKKRCELHIDDIGF